MKNNRAFSALVNERIAVREHRLLRRDEAHNEKRTGLSPVPSPGATENFNQAELNRICEALQRSRSSSLSVSDLRSLKQLLLHTEGISAFMKNSAALHGLIGELSGMSGKRVIHQLEAAYVCANLGLGKEEHSLPVCRAAGSYLVQFLEGSNYHLQEASTWAIGNLAGTSIKCAAVLCSQGVVSHLIQLLSSPQKDLKLSAAYALSHIIHVQALLQKDELVGIVQLSPSFVSAEPDLCVLLYVLSCIPSCEEMMLDERIVSRIFAVLPNLVRSGKECLKAITALLRTVGNLTCGPGALELICIEDAGPFLKTLFEFPHKHVCKECAWVCANLLCHENPNVRNFAEHAGLRKSVENFLTLNNSPVCT